MNYGDYGVSPNSGLCETLRASSKMYSAVAAKTQSSNTPPGVHNWTRQSKRH